MNIFRKFEQLGYEISEEYLNATYDIHSKEAIRETATLVNWLWENHSIWIMMRREINAFAWYIDSPSLSHHTNGKVFASPQQAYINSFEAILTAFDFIQHQQTKQL